jgi:phosphoglycerate dehydrogenase-like enzyme
MSVNYLSTLTFDEEWLAALRRRSPGVQVTQLPAERAGDIPDRVWADLDVLHTSTVFPDLTAAPRLRWVQLDTSGVDHLRGTPLWHSDLAITTIGGVSPVPLAEYVMFAVLGSAHHLPALLDVQNRHDWPTPARRWQTMLPRPVAGATIGIVGYGRIGREIGRLARAHGMQVLAVNRTGRLHSAARGTDQANFASGDDSGADVELFASNRLKEVLERCDFVVIVVPLTEQTGGLLDREMIAAIKPGATLINVSRGGIVNESALLEALNSGAISTVVLDVFEEEPLPPNSPWWSEPNAFVTPHVAGLAPRYAEQVLDIVVENLNRFVAGKPLLNLVDRARGY